MINAIHSPFNFVVTANVRGAIRKYGVTAMTYRGARGQFIGAMQARGITNNPKIIRVQRVAGNPVAIDYANV